MNIFKKIVTSFAIIAMMFITLPAIVVNAQTGSVDPCKASSTATGCSSSIFKTLGLDKIGSGTSGIQGAIIGLANLLVLLIASISVVYLLINAYKMMSDDGSGKSWSAGLNGVKYALGGLVIALLSFGIVSFVSGFVLK